MMKSTRRLMTEQQQNEAEKEIKLKVFAAQCAHFCADSIIIRWFGFFLLSLCAFFTSFRFNCWKRRICTSSGESRAATIRPVEGDSVYRDRFRVSPNIVISLVNGQSIDCEAAIIEATPADRFSILRCYYTWSLWIWGFVMVQELVKIHVHLRPSFFCIKTEAMRKGKQQTNEERCLQWSRWSSFWQWRRQRCRCREGDLFLAGGAKCLRSTLRTHFFGHFREFGEEKI